LSTSAEETPYLLQSYIDEARALEKQLVQITWYMRGGIPLDQAGMLSPTQRKHALALIDENIERTSKSGMALL
jgi:hypothetical protein